MGGFSVWGNATRERQFHLADREVARVDDLGSDVNAVLELKRDQVGLAVFEFIESGFFPRAALDVCEGVVVVDGGDQEWLAARLSVARVVELEVRCVAGAGASGLLGGASLGRADLCPGLGTEGFSLLFLRPGLPPLG